MTMKVNLFDKLLFSLSAEQIAIYAGRVLRRPCLYFHYGTPIRQKTSAPKYTLPFAVTSRPLLADI